MAARSSPSRLKRSWALDPQVHVEVAGGPAPWAHRAAAGQAQGRAAVHAGGHVDGVGAVVDLAALAVAATTRLAG